MKVPDMLFLGALWWFGRGLELRDPVLINTGLVLAFFSLSAYCLLKLWQVKKDDDLYELMNQTTQELPALGTEHVPKSKMDK